MPLSMPSEALLYLFLDIHSASKGIDGGEEELGCELQPKKCEFISPEETETIFKNY